MQYGILPTVPQYFIDFIDAKVDLSKEPKQCCPFHKEDTPSFSYDGRSGRWSCFGRCHAHGDVVDMHQRWMKLSNRSEAEKDLRAKYRVAEPTTKEKLEDVRYVKPILQTEVDFEVAYLTAISLARTPEDYCELDCIMAVYPVEIISLLEFIEERTVNSNG